jgi:enamine deaminase RidA (YjgF/YER057c/UK114 family)
MSEQINSSRAPEPVGPYPHARRAGNLLFLSGVGPRVRGSKEIPGVVLRADGSIASYDIELQCRNCFAKTRDGITFGAGADAFRIALCATCRKLLAALLEVGR